MEKEKQQRIFTGRAYHRYCYHGYLVGILAPQFIQYVENQEQSTD
ncbi:MAG: hypothetical protein LKM35_08695 [Lachnospiraceae bacterium]|jgi:hypothetical protein|nr:hypothetical protein [Lachnospiraceae bacterium]